MPVFTIFGLKIKIFSLKIGPNRKNGYRPFHALKLDKPFPFEIYFEEIKVVYPNGPGFRIGRGRISFEHPCRIE